MTILLSIYSNEFLKTYRHYVLLTLLQEVSVEEIVGVVSRMLEKRT